MEFVRFTHKTLSSITQSLEKGVLWVFVFQANKEHHGNGARSANEDVVVVKEGPVVVHDGQVDDDPFDLARGGEDPTPSADLASTHAGGGKKRHHSSAFATDINPGTGGKRPRGGSLDENGKHGSAGSNNKRPREDGVPVDGERSCTCLLLLSCSFDGATLQHV